jgi:hypothetical protein
MSFANFAAGVAGGYMQGKIAKKRDKRSETMDEIATQYMKARTDSINKGTAKAEEEKDDDKIISSNLMDPLNQFKVPAAAANGGFIGELPNNYDRFSWQRQNFKKNQPEQAEGSMLVVTVK